VVKTSQSLLCNNYGVFRPRQLTLCPEGYWTFPWRAAGSKNRSGSPAWLCWTRSLAKVCLSIPSWFCPSSRSSCRVMFCILAMPKTVRSRSLRINSGGLWSVPMLGLPPALPGSPAVLGWRAMGVCC